MTAQPLRRGLEGALVGAALALFEVAEWAPRRGVHVDPALLVPIALLWAAATSAAWMALDALLAVFRLFPGRGRLHFAAATGLALGLGAWSGAAPESPRHGADSPRSVVVFLVDTLRVDRTAPHGAARDTMPTLARLAEQGWFFERAYTPSPWTLPSVAGIFTGLDPRGHRVSQMAGALDERPPTIAEHFAGHGARTFASVANGLLVPSSGFGRGFDRYRAPGTSFEHTLIGAGVLALLGEAHPLWAWIVDFEEPWNPPGDYRYTRSARSVAKDFDTWLRWVGEAPYFAYLHVFEPHDPYEAPAPFRGRFDKGSDAPASPPNSDAAPRIEGRHASLHRDAWLDRYDEELLAVDEALEGVLDSLRTRGRERDTIVAVVSDHGEEFHDRGGWKHGRHVFDELVRGLLVLRVPGEAPRSTSTPVELRKLGAWLSVLAGLPATHPEHAQTLERALAGEASTEAVVVEHHPSEDRDPHTSLAAIRWPWKLLRHSSPAGAQRWLFDLAADPGESVDRSREHPDVVAALEATLAGRSAPDDDATSPEAIERLRALGYL